MPPFLEADHIRGSTAAHVRLVQNLCLCVAVDMPLVQSSCLMTQISSLALDETATISYIWCLRWTERLESITKLHSLCGGWLQLHSAEQQMTKSANCWLVQQTSASQNRPRSPEAALLTFRSEAMLESLRRAAGTAGSAYSAPKPAPYWPFCRFHVTPLAPIATGLRFSFCVLPLRDK